MFFSGLAYMTKPMKEYSPILALTILHSQVIFTAALALRSRGLVIGSREKEEREREKEEEEKNLQIAIRCLWDLFD